MGSIMGNVKDLAIGSGVALVGMAAGRTISNLIPFSSSNPSTQPVVDFAKGTVVAIAIRMFGQKVLGRDLARIAAIGAMIGPTKNLILAYAPSASSFLGAYDSPMAMPRFSRAGRIAAYPGGVASYSGGGDGMGSYSEVYPG